MNKNCKGGTKRAKSATKRRSSNSSRKLRRARSYKATPSPSGVISRYINNKKKVIQIPPGAPNCSRNDYDDNRKCYTDPITYNCLKLNNVVQHPTDNKRCFDRNKICQWFRTRPRNGWDDPLSREQFSNDWKNKTCNNNETIKDTIQRIRRTRTDTVGMRNNPLLRMNETAHSIMSRMNANPAYGEDNVLERAQMALIAWRAANNYYQERPSSLSSANLIRSTDILYNLSGELFQQGYTAAGNQIRNLLRGNIEPDNFDDVYN